MSVLAHSTIVLLLVTACTGCQSLLGLPSEQGTVVDAVAVDAEVTLPACDHSKPFGPATGTSGILTGSGLHFSPDMRDVFFNDIRAGGIGGHDIFTAHRDDVASPFGAATRLDSVNSPSDDVVPSVTGDGLSMIFESSRTGSFGMFSASRGAPTSPFGNVVQVTTLGAISIDPFVLENGGVLYYRAAVGNKAKIARATLGGGGFANGVLVDSVNSAEDDTAPVLTPDELTIFFASTRGGGQDDIWTATRASVNEPFGAPTNVMELNTAGREVPSFVSADGCTLFFDRIDGGVTPLMATRSL